MPAELPELTTLLKRNNVVLNNEDVGLLSSSSTRSGRVSLGASGRDIFLKRQTGRSARRMLECELAGLQALAKSSTVRVPQTYGLAVVHSDPALVLEYVQSGRATASVEKKLGVSLSRLHREDTREEPGFGHDNFIGLGVQQNNSRRTWLDFFAEQRINVQVTRARINGLLDKRDVASAEKVCSRLGNYLPDSGPMSLLHGDLWAGNFMASSRGEAVLIDPACYYGHREADIAMTKLFGGFSDAFYASYSDQWPLESGFLDRVELYNLYHLLNHLNIFGSQYAGSVRRILSHYA